MHRYTKNSKYISNELRDFYEENGYIVIRKLVDHELLDECMRRFIDYCDETAENPVRITLMQDKFLRSKNVKGEHLVVKAQDFAYDNVLFKYISYAPMVDIVESIIGPNITACHTMLINKPPDTVKDLSEHPIHQDLHYFPFRPADSIVASWTAMEKVNKENGCLFVVPGSHKNEELYKHDYKKSSTNAPMYHEAQLPGNHSEVELCMEKGDTVFFHPLLLHGSWPNLTKGFRKAISCHYADTKCYFIDVTGTVQENISNEVTTIANKLFRTNLSFSQVWKLKSRLVRGSPGSFQQYDSKL